MRRCRASVLLGLFAVVTLNSQADDAAGVWLDVPFIKQTNEGCGAASIAMLLQYWNAHGTSVASERQDADAILKQLYSRSGHGILLRIWSGI